MCSQEGIDPICGNDPPAAPATRAARRVSQKLELPPWSDAEPEIAGSPDSEAIVAWLRRPRSYSEPTGGVQFIETHISWIFLTDRFAYKLKKPVQYDFLDFSTAQLRRHWCEEEVRLNRRLAPGVYVGVVPITKQRRGAWKLGGKGRAVDWLVKMRRLPADHSLDSLLLNNELTEGRLVQLADTLAAFYQQLPPVTLRTDEYRRRIDDHVQANRHELMESVHHFGLSLVKRVHAAQLRFLRLTPDILDNRVRDGRIVEGHGDLRPEHIYLNAHPTIIDCIEFNKDLRQLDVLDELGFLAMECDHLGMGSVGMRIIEHYQGMMSDLAPSILLDFYKSYRATVRAKVLSLRASQLEAPAENERLDAADHYLRLADRYGLSMGPTMLLIVRGLPGTGKSSLASRLAESLGIEWLQTDSIRREMFGPRPAPAGYNDSHYCPSARRAVYDEMFGRAAQLLNEGLSVVLDGTFLSVDQRREAASLAQRHRAKTLVIHCQCPNEIALERIAERLDRGSSLSDAQPAFFDHQQQANEPDSPGSPSLVVDTTNALPAMERTVFSRLRTMLLNIEEP